MTVVKRGWLQDPRIKPSLIFGIVVLVFMILVGTFGPMLLSEKLARVGAVEPNLPPTAKHVFGTDSQGRDVFTTTIMAIPPTLRVGVTAGIISVILGLALGLIAGFFGGCPAATGNALSGEMHHGRLALERGRVDLARLGVPQNVSRLGILAHESRDAVAPGGQ